MPLFLLFLIVPLVEIGLFIQVGGWIGLWPTLAIVILTAIIGTVMIREQGLRELARLRESFDELRDPTEPLANGAMILFAGALLLTPGFFTDTVGFLLLIPRVRRAVFGYLRTRVTIHQAHVRQKTRSGSAGGSGDVIDGDYTDISHRGDGQLGKSGWTRH